jgi:hypothetical protein
VGLRLAHERATECDDGIVPVERHVRVGRGCFVDERRVERAVHRGANLILRAEDEGRGDDGVVVARKGDALRFEERDALRAWRRSYGDRRDDAPALVAGTSAHLRAKERALDLLAVHLAPNARAPR